MQIAGGILLIILGLFALSSLITTTFLTTYFFGWILLIGGLVGSFYGLFAARYDKAIIIAEGILAFVLGGLLLANPTISIGVITLFFAFYFIVSGLIRMVTAFGDPSQNPTWSVILGIISLFLGFAVLNQWPISGFVLIGLLVGVQLIVSGFAIISRSMMPQYYERRARPSMTTGMAGAKGGKSSDDEDE